jgi:hypothetical protein
MRARIFKEEGEEETKLKGIKDERKGEEWE